MPTNASRSGSPAPEVEDRHSRVTARYSTPRVPGESDDDEYEPLADADLMDVGDELVEADEAPEDRESGKSR